MPGTFFGLSIGASGLAAAQVGLDVTGQNIANANTPGYAVQSLHQTASDPYTSADKGTLLTPGLLGSGVSVRGIQRASDQFLDTQVRDANSNLSGQAAQSNALKQVGAAFGEPSATGLNAALSSFFNAFHDVAGSPENIGVRTAAVQQGAALASAFGTVQSGLTETAASLASQASSDTQSINNYSTQIAALNVSIRASTRDGQPPNDLLDQRGALLDKLSGLANIAVQNTADGTVNVSVGATPLVLGVDSYAVTLPGLTASGDLTGGALAGIVKSQAQVAAYQGQVNTLAASVTSQVNAAQAGGLDANGNPGPAFFTVTTGNEAATLRLNPALEADPRRLAAASVPTPPATFGAGDGANAQAIAGLLTSATAALGGASIQSFYHQTVSDAGSRAATAQSGTATASAGYTQLSNQRLSSTGVSTDTELTNLLKYQRAYQASARVVSVSDDLLGTIINNLFSGR